MNIWQAIILGTIQGLTEFLPVSSSAHLVIAQHFLGLSEPGGMVVFDILLHIGTLGAVIVYFREDIADILRNLAWWKPDVNKAKFRLAAMVILGTIPTGIIGLVFKKPLEALFDAALPVSFMLLITGCILWAADHVVTGDRNLDNLGWKDALLIGTMQGVAILPGISRSGSTISAGIFRRMKREQAARYSFLLFIPAILGAVVLEARKLAHASTTNMLPVVLGAGAAAVVGYLSIGWLLKLVQHKRFRYFAYYCWLAGLASIAGIWIFH